MTSNAAAKGTARNKEVKAFFHKEGDVGKSEKGDGVGNAFGQ
jgi:hypothetical protein